jgi:hypothetical protein
MSALDDYVAAVDVWFDGEDDDPVLDDMLDAAWTRLTTPERWHATHVVAAFWGVPVLTFPFPRGAP